MYVSVKLVVKYDNGDQDTMSEKDLLQVFAQMKREINVTNKRKRAGATQVGKRKRDATSQEGKRVRSCRL